MSTTPTTPRTAGTHPELETVAAFVDGRLSAEARRRMVEHLATCDDCQELVSETVLLLREPDADDDRDADPEADGDEAGEAPPRSGRLLVPPPGRFRRALPLIAALGAAACLVMLLWTPAGDWILGRGEGVRAAKLVAALPTGRTALRERLAQGVDEHGWPQVLGGVPPATPAQEATFRLGVRLVELDAALRSGDTETARIVLARIDALLEGLEMPPGLARYYVGPDGIADGLSSGMPLPELLDRSDQADDLLTPDPRHGPGPIDATYLALGKWAEAAQLAAAAGDVDWFGETAPRRQLAQLRRAELPADLADPFATVVELVDAGPAAADLPRLQQALADLIARGGSPERR